MQHSSFPKSLKIIILIASAVIATVLVGLLTIHILTILTPEEKTQETSSSETTQREVEEPKGGLVDETVPELDDADASSTIEAPDDQPLPGSSE